MLEILPIKLLRDEDAPIFGPLNVVLGKLARLDFPVANGIVVTAPELHLKTVLEYYDCAHKEIFEQTLILVKKEIEKTPVPEILISETKTHNKFLLGSQATPGSVKELWIALLHEWLEEIKKRLWKDGFYPGIAQNLEPKLVIFLKKPEASGIAFFDSLQDDVVINIQTGKLHPNDQRKLFEIVQDANKKLFIPHEYEWIIDKGLKLTGIKSYTQPVILSAIEGSLTKVSPTSNDKSKSTVKVFLDLSKGLVIEREVDGIYISSEKIFDLNKPQTSWEELVFKLVECAHTFPNSPILMKLADMSEGMGKVRGALRLIHQKSLLDRLCEALLFARNKKELRNIHVVIPFVRGVNELVGLKRELAVRKLIRKNNFQVWLELAVPENVINLEDYLTQGVDGIVLNLDELSAHLSGYDHREQEVSFYKHEVTGLLKFLEDGIKLLHQSKIPFIAYGSLSLNPTVLDFLIEKGVYGIVVERFEAPSITELLHNAEKRMILRRTS
ncbi:MAG: Uncharacterized protein G01um10147_776 [Microgenomates group bacterium Gr01-1014_7]|nr:MAG: Uncharacterized protein G01um10147_776 [Microgenomates group bacterium Gr01-1014_7]